MHFIFNPLVNCFVLFSRGIYLEDFFFFFALSDNYNILYIFLFCALIVLGKRTLMVMFLFYFVIGCYWVTQYRGAETLQISLTLWGFLCVKSAAYPVKPWTSILTPWFRLASCGPEGSVSELSISFCLVSQLSNHDKGQIILLETWCNLAHSCLTSFLRGKGKKNISTL